MKAGPPAQGAGGGSSVYSCTSRQQGDPHSAPPQERAQAPHPVTDPCVQCERQQRATPGVFASGEYLIMYMFDACCIIFFQTGDLFFFQPG